LAQHGMSFVVIYLTDAFLHFTSIILPVSQILASSLLQHILPLSSFLEHLCISLVFPLPSQPFFMSSFLRGKKMSYYICWGESIQ